MLIVSARLQTSQIIINNLQIAMQNAAVHELIHLQLFLLSVIRGLEANSKQHGLSGRESITGLTHISRC